MIFSIIIPVYNIKNYLQECIDGILEQTFDDYEIILVDDGSNDGSGEMCDEYADKYENIRVIHKDNEGQGQARNIGIYNSRGDYLLFIDGDDTLYNKNVLEKLYSKCNGCDIISFNWTEYYDKQKIEKKYMAYELSDMDITYSNGKLYLKKALEFNSLYKWYVVRYAIRTDFWKQNHFSFKKNIKYEDVDLGYELICKAGVVEVLNEIVYCYRLARPNSTCTEVNIKTYIDGLNVIGRNIKSIEQNDSIDSQLKAYLNNNFSCLYYSFLIQASRVKDKKQQKILWGELEARKWICNYTMEKEQRLVAKFIRFLGIPNTSRLLGFRRKLRILTKRQY